MCDKQVEGPVVAFPCNIPGVHDGPCAAPEIPRSMRERERWNAEQQQAQQEAQAAAEQAEQEDLRPPAIIPNSERLTEGALPHPDARPETRTERPQPSPQDQEVFSRLSSIEARGVGRIAEPGPDEQSARARGMERQEQIQQDQALQRAVQHASQSVEARAAQEPTKQREGDQALPHPGQTGQGSVQDRVIAKTRQLIDEYGDTGMLDVASAEAIIAQAEESKRVGIERYGRPLEPFNGRDSLQDFVDELRDALMYGTQMIMAREADREMLVGVVTSALVDYQDQATSGNRSMTAHDVARVAVNAILLAVGPADGMQG